MMTKYPSTNLKLLFLLPLMAACGVSGIQLGEFNSRTDQSYCADEFCTDGPIASESVKTVAILSGSQILKSWESCLGVTASGNTRNSFNSAKPMLPTEGEPEAATAPIMLQALTLAGNICNDLVQRERNLSAEDKRIFKNVDLNSGENPFTKTAIEDVVTQISRSCYGRRPAQEDKTEAFRAMVDIDSVTGSGVDNTRRRAMMLCAGLMASASGFNF